MGIKQILKTLNQKVSVGFVCCVIFVFVFKTIYCFKLLFIY